MDIENIFTVPEINDNDMSKMVLIIHILYQKFINKEYCTRERMIHIINKIGRENKIIPSIRNLQYVYRKMILQNEIQHNKSFENLFRTKIIRSISGVVVITVFTSPYPETSHGIQMFSCKYNCFYCPREPNQPRSYLTKEPAVARANQCNFQSIEQFWERSKNYIIMGHPLDKIELIISGGTFTSYPREYIVNFFRDQFYAANTVIDKFNNIELRRPLTLEEEQNINQNNAEVKIIGITIETRPDQVTKDELIFLRKLGVTRVQIGVQHIDDRILQYINRGCTNNDTINAIKMLKNSGFKVDIHIMPDLPHPDNILQDEMIELDKHMFDEIINNPNYQADQWKIYPCQVVPWTKIKEWYDENKYHPYSNVVRSDGSNPLFEMLINVKQNIKPWIRLNRVIRDIPQTYVSGGNDITSLRNDLLVEVKKRGLKCNCIRCHEIKDKNINQNDYHINVRQYDASDGEEFFITWENDDNLLGLLRLRINKSNINDIFPELSDCSMIRELHIYGQVINHDDDNNGVGVQHMGLGKALINKAIEITREHHLQKISVISGIGVRNYYMNQNFQLCVKYNDAIGRHDALGQFLIKNI